MKRLVIKISILAVLVAVLPCLPALAQPTHLPHENPDTAINMLDEAGLLLSYVHINNLASQSQFQSARDTLKEMDNADIPADIRYIFNQYNNLYQNLFTTLDNLESLLNETSDLLSRNQINEARQRLDDAGPNIREANSLLRDTEAATDSLSDRLSFFKTAATNELTDAYDRLGDSVKRLKDVIDKLTSLRESLTERYTYMTKLTPTELSLNASPLTAFVGENITVSGRLSDNGTPLTKREILLSLEYKSMKNINKKNIPIKATANTTTTTGCDGLYFASITIPYQYVDNMTLTAIYEPSGTDIRNYLSSKSQPVTIKPLFYHTYLKVTMPQGLYRGQPFSISGEVTSDNASISRNISVHLDSTLLAEKNISGSFNLEITQSGNTTSRKGELTVAVAPDGRYSGASQSRYITISSTPAHIDTKIPSIVLLPASIKISGRVYGEFGPIADVPVSLKFNNSLTTAATAPDGSFQRVFNLHILPEKTPVSDSQHDLSPIGSHEIAVTIDRGESRGTIIGEESRIITINPLSTGLIMAILTSLGLVIYRRAHTRTSRQRVIPPAEPVALPTISPSPPIPSMPKLTAIKSKIFSAYRSGLAIIEKITGIVMAPHITMREFLKMTPLPSPNVSECFAELTAITEIALYSSREPPQETVTRAEKLAATIAEEAGVGNP
jgi:hypothetical protein